MFVDIEDFKSALVVENILTPYKKGQFAQDKKTRLPKEPITSEVCMEILKSTNYARNIKDMLQCIADLPMHEQAQCKDVVLAVFSNREQPQSVWDLGRKLAETSGYEKEFDEACVLKEGIIIDSAPYYSTGLGVGTEPLSYEDLATHSKLIAVGDKINFKNVGNLPAVVDVSRCAEVNLSGNDLADVAPLYFRKGAKVILNGVQNPPRNLDFSQCAEVDFDGADWHRTERLIFRNRKQMEKCQSLCLPEDWKGQILFKDEMQAELDKYQEGQNLDLALLKLKGEGR